MSHLWRTYATSIILAGLVWFLSVHDLVWLALVIVLIAEWPRYDRRPNLNELLRVVPEVVVGLSAALVISLFPRAISQDIVAVTYAAWRLVIAPPRLRQRLGWALAAITQIAAFEALFLWSAIGHPPRIVVLVCLFAASFAIVYDRLNTLGERAAAVLAATWAVIAVEAAWVFMSWLVSYVIIGGYFVVPQPTIILSGIGYCAGSIYLAGKRGELSRARLGEYLVITFVLILVVVAGTGWRGTI